MAIVIGPTPPGHGRHVPCNLHRRGVDVADETGVRSVHPDVDHGRAALDHVGRHEPGTTGGDDEHVGVERLAREVARARVADRHRRVLLQQQVGDGLADDVAAPDDDGLRALQLRSSYSASSAMIPTGVAATSVGRPR